MADVFVSEASGDASKFDGKRSVLNDTFVSIADEHADKLGSGGQSDWSFLRLVTGPSSFFDDEKLV